MIVSLLLLRIVQFINGGVWVTGYSLFFFHVNRMGVRVRGYLFFFCFMVMMLRGSFLFASFFFFALSNSG